MTKRSLVGSFAAFSVAGAFLSSAILKFRAPKDFEHAVVEFGVPEKFSEFTSRAIIGLELVTALGMIPIRTRHLAARTSGGILGAFSVGVAANILTGRRPSCNCFGSMSDAPISGKTIIRNVGLISLSLLASPVPAIRPMTRRRWITRDGIILLGSGLVSLTSIGLTLEAIRRYGKLAKNLDSYGLLTTASTGAARDFVDVPIRDINGERSLLSEHRDPARRFNIFFSDLGCKSCGRVIAYLDELTRQSPPSSQQLLILLNTPEEADLNLPSSVRENPLIQVLLDDGVAGETFGIPQYPSAVLFDIEGRAISELHMGPDSVMEAIGRSWEVDSHMDLMGVEGGTRRK